MTRQLVKETVINKPTAILQSGERFVILVVGAFGHELGLVFDVDGKPRHLHRRHMQGVEGERCIKTGG